MDIDNKTAKPNIKISHHNITMNKKTMMVMLFYAILTFLAGPVAGEQLRGKEGIGYGMIAGAVVSIALWYTVGSKYAR